MKDGQAKSILTATFAVGAVMLLVGAASYITHWNLSPYIYTVGALLVALSQWLTPTPSSASVTVRRLYRQQSLGALFLVVTGILMFTTRGNAWIASLTIAAVIYLYTAIRIANSE